MPVPFTGQLRTSHQFTVLRDSSPILLIDTGTLNFAFASRRRRLVLVHSKVSLFALDFTGIYGISTFLIWNQDDTLIGEAFPGDGSGIDCRKHRDYDSKEEDTILSLSHILLYMKRSVC